MKAQESKGTSRLLVAVAVMAAVAALALALWGCAPQATTSMAATGGDAEATEEAAPSMYPDFTDRTSGNFNDTFSTTDMLNAGNRGCNACHEDLWDVMNMKDGYKHILTHVGYDKALTYQDCEPCHRGHTALTGPYLGDLIHAAHYGSKVFQEANGNCWSCHAMNSAGGQGDYQLVLWDDFYDEPALGGYPNIDGNEMEQAWVDSRGFFGGFVNGMTQDEAPAIDVKLDQAVTDHDDVFIVNNWGPEVTEKNGEPFSFDAVCSEENTVSLTGVKNPRSFTKAELEAMPQTEFTMALACATNGRGGSLVSNIPMSGVSVAYLIEQCGGLADGVNAVNATGYDGWQAFPPMNLEASTYTENAYIALKYYGEDLSQDDGAPMTLVSLGNPGARQVKHIKSIDFTQDEAFFQGPMMAESDEPSPSYPINGMWFQEDGITAKVGEPVTLTGAVYSWNRVVGDLASVNFSFDMGKTWQDVKIADQVTDFDPFQWVTYSLDWTPSKAGKYQVKLQATDANGVQMKKPVTLFVNVEE